MARVTAVGGIVVAVDSDWDMIALEIGPAARERSDRILATSKALAIKEPRIGRQLHGLFRAAGLGDVKVEILAGADTTGRSLPMLKASFARYARDSGTIPPENGDRWFEDIDHSYTTGSPLLHLPRASCRPTTHKP